MQWNIPLLCSFVCFYLLCFGPVFPATEKLSKCRYDQHTQMCQKAHITKRFCDPSFNNQRAGAITQKCGTGFYREAAGPRRGQCLPCSCNGLSNECDEHTGKCVNCQFNTTGDRCERCKEGYYGNAAKRNCRACPCPSTRNNFGLACLDIGSGVVECLCKRGYSGAKCERCAFGYYGNPVVDGGSCKPCNCNNSTLNICDSLTGECDSCTTALLLNLEMDDILALLEQQLQNITDDSGSVSRLGHQEANISETKTLIGSYNSAVSYLDLKVEQLEEDVDLVRADLNQLIDKDHENVSDLEKDMQNANETNLKAEDLLSEAKRHLTAAQDLIKRLTEVKQEERVTQKDKARMMAEDRGKMQEMRRGCAIQRGRAGREQEQAHTLLNIIRTVTNQTALQQTGNSLTALDASLREAAELLSDAGDRIDRTLGLNLKSSTVLRLLEHLHPQLEREKSALLPVTEITKGLLKNITDIFLMLEEIKKEFENHAAQLDGAKLELKVDILTKAEEHAEALNRVVTEVKLVLHNTAKRIKVLNVLGMEAAIGIAKAKLAANLSKEAADQALKDMKEGGLVNRAAGLKDNSSGLWTEASEMQSGLKLNAHRDWVKKQKKKGKSMRNDISAVANDIKGIKGIKKDDTEVLIESAKMAVSACNFTVSNMTERLRKISQEIESITLTNENRDNMLADADQALKNLNRALPALKDSITQVEALSRQVPHGANLTESLRRIKEVIEVTRNYVNRLSLATTFNGKGHVELHPPRNLKDISAFTAVDLLINRHRNNPSEAVYKRRRRQDRHRDASFFVFYLGDKNASGDYVGMAIRNSVLICVYKLGGVVHEVETSQITTTDVNSSFFDRVIFHRVYQDAEVNVTQNFTSQNPVSSSFKRYLPNTRTGILKLDPDSLVVYVGGYPEDFMPPMELHYPRYRGAMKLSYINDNPVCLFNYKHAVNMDSKPPFVKFHESGMSDYYEGTGYCMAFVKKPFKLKRSLKFRTNSRETNALLFYIGNEESFFCVFLERGFLVLQGQQAGGELRLHSAEKVSLIDQSFGITIADTFIVHYGQNHRQITAAHSQTTYMSYYIGGLPALLRQRYNITAPPLRGCVAHVTEDAKTVKFNKMIGVTAGCPVSQLGVRSATLYSALSADSLVVRAEQPLQVSLGFRSMDRNGTLLSSSQGSPYARNFQLSLADGYAVFNSDNYTLRSNRRYSDGSWHYLTAVGGPTGLELSIDNVKVTHGQSPHNTSWEQNLQEGKFTACISNLYIRRPDQRITPADLSLLSSEGDVLLGLCSPLPGPQTRVLPALILKRPQKHTLTQTQAGSHCRQRRAQRGEYQLSEEHSWLRYTLPQEDLNYRPHFSFDINTKSSKGLIFHVGGRGAVPLLALYMANGKIKMTLGQTRIIHHKQKSNDGNWHTAEFSVEKSTFHLMVDGIRVTDGLLPNNEGSSLELHNPVYFGGDPTGKNTKGHKVPMNSVIGCIRNFKMYEDNTWKPVASHKTLPCFKRFTEMGTYFGGGYIILEKYFSIGSQFVLAFELRPKRLTGLLFHVQGLRASLDVFIKETEVGVKVNDGNGAVGVSVTPRRSLCDGKFHVVTVSKQPEVIKLVVDSVSEQRAVPNTATSDSATLYTLYVGGTTKENQVTVSSPFMGCLRKVKLNGQRVAFEKNSRVFGPVHINKCPAD